MFKTIMTSILLLFFSTHSNADEIIKFLVGFAPGGGQHIVANILSNAAKAQGINNHIVFKPGAGGIIGMNECVTESNKNMLCLATQAQYVHSTLLKDSIRKFNPEELTYVKVIGASPGVLITNTSNTKSLQEIIADIKTNKINFGSGALGLTVLTNWVLKQINPLDAAIANYNGTGPVLNSIMGKQVDYAIMPYTVAKNAYTNGQIRIVATLGESVELEGLGIPLLQTIIPNIPNDHTIFGIVMAPNLDYNQIKKHEVMLTQILSSNIVKQKLIEQGIFPISTALKNFSFADIARLERIKLNQLLEAMPKN